MVTGDSEAGESFSNSSFDLHDGVVSCVVFDGSVLR